MSVAGAMTQLTSPGKRGYLTWRGKLIEGPGVTPSIPVAQPPEQLLAGEDPQMQRALELARQL